MARNENHSMLSPITYEEKLREQFIYQLKRHIGKNLRSGNHLIFKHLAAPAYKKQYGKVPESVKEISKAMYKQNDYLLFCAINRNAQQMMWNSLIEPIYRDDSNLQNKYMDLSNNKNKKGSLSLNKDFNIPKAIKENDIHLQPGGFAADYGSNDVLAGALHEAGTNLYSRSGGIGTKESKAEVVMRFINKKFPNFKPTKILDIACSSGPSSTPWALAFPDAEVHAIDVGASLLRYAHARAESLNAPVHFHQMDASNTSFEDQSFDLVISHNAMHEMSQKTVERMFKESYRLLIPGGIAIHQDVPLRFNELDNYSKFENSWDQKNNNEPFWTVYAENDPKKMFLEAKFHEKDIWIGKFQQLDQTISWFISAAVKN